LTAESALVVLMRESLDSAIPLPKLYIVAVHQLPGVLFRALVIGTEKFDCAKKLAVCSDDVHSIFGHLISVRTHAITKATGCLSSSGTGDGLFEKIRVCGGAAAEHARTLRRPLIARVVWAGFRATCQHDRIAIAFGK